MDEKEATKQHRPLTGTDVRVLATGYWNRYFSWRVHPRVKWLWLIGVSAFILLIILAAVADFDDAMPAGYRVLLVLSGAVGIIGIVAGFGIHIMDKEHYVNRCVDSWERGDHTLPDEASVVRYIKKSKRAEEDDVVSV